MENRSYVSERSPQQKLRKADGANEDTFFVSHAERLEKSGGALILPNRSMAYRFAQEVDCDDLNQEFTVPLGLHASWNYHSQEWMAKMLQYSLPIIN